MPEPSRQPLERRHTETAQNAAPQEGAPEPESDAEGTRILLIVVAMLLLMFTIAVVGLIFIARPHGVR